MDHIPVNRELPLAWTVLPLLLLVRDADHPDTQAQLVPAGAGPEHGRGSKE